MANFQEFPVTLKDVRWARPGNIEISVSKKFYTKSGDPGVVDYASVFFGGNFKLIESNIVFNGTTSEKICKYRSAYHLYSRDAADGPESEKESWSLSVAMDQKEITTHPNAKAVAAAGFGVIYQDSIWWPRMIPGEGESGPIKNPYFGTKYYLCPRIEITLEKFYDSAGGGIDFNQSVGWLDSGAGGFPFMSGNSFIMSGKIIQKSKDSRIVKTTWTTQAPLPEPVYSKEWSYV
jgi:hypothetical protein